MAPSPHGASILDADDATLRWALGDAHTAALMASMAYITGDPSIIRGDVRPVPDLFGYDEDGLGEADRESIRDRAFETLRAYRDSGAAPPPAPSRDVVREIIDFIGGEPPPDGYDELLEEELDPDFGDPRGAAGAALGELADRAAFKVLIVGAGMSGILAAHRCRQAGLDFVVIEKDAQPTGTWYENTYPGCRVDSYNHVYAYSFVPYNDWPMYFSKREDIFAYFNHCIDHFGIRDRIRLGTRVEEAVFDELTARWAVTVVGSDGARETLHANAVISAVGQLNIPKLPAIRGMERFAGAAFHSAEWDHSVDLSGKRVAVVGTGASATQFVPEIAAHVGHMTVFQRTPPWLLPTARYHQPISDQQRWLFTHVPYYERWYRLWTFRVAGADGALPYLCGEEGWSGPANAVGTANDELRAALTDYIAAQLADRPDLCARSIPDYPPGGKRPLRDCGVWLDALKRDNVELVDEAITEITPRGLRTADGREYAADVLIFGTGFRADHFLSTLRVVGRGGVELARQWAEAPRAYKGIAVPNFPNLFCLYGPNTNIVVGSSIIFFVECQARYVMHCIRELLAQGARSLEVRREVHEAWVERVDAANARMAWGAPNVQSWYKNARGIVTQNWPGTHLEYWRETRSLDRDDYHWC
jgi:4-hydroxyacetophenone monooxygenase